MITTLIALLGPATVVLKGLDPIELLQGKEVVGRTDLKAVYLRHEYHFSNLQNLKTFVKQPVRYAVQAGGACGKMGALTGKGSPDRWAVANGQIILFASDGCRETFLANKERYFAPIAALPIVSAKDREEAEAIYRRVIAAHGGPSLKAVSQIEWTYETPYTDKETPKIWKSRYAVLSPTKLAQWEDWDAGRSFFVIDGKLAREGKPSEVYDLHRDEARELTASFARHPIGIILGAGGVVLKLLGDRPGFVMLRDDILFKVVLDPVSSMIAQVEYRDRHKGPISNVVVEYSNYVDVNGVMVPQTHRVRADEGEWSKPKTMVGLKVNGALPVVFADAMAQ